MCTRDSFQDLGNAGSDRDQNVVAGDRITRDRHDTGGQRLVLFDHFGKRKARRRIEKHCLYDLFRFFSQRKLDFIEGLDQKRLAALRETRLKQLDLHFSVHAALFGICDGAGQCVDLVRPGLFDTEDDLFDVADTA